tara:strand:+ start:1402 stop:1506 length:105 start_codon:yes stop_codon:yes gene_type:complete
MIYKPKEKNVKKLKTFLKKEENNKTKKLKNGNSI